MENGPFDHLPKSTPWEQFLTSLKEEASWLLHTMGMITLSLAIGRLITKLTGSGKVDPGAFSSTWNEQVNQALRKREEANGARTRSQNEREE